MQPYVDDLGSVVDLDGDPRRAAHARRRPAGRRERRLLGADRRALRARPHRRQPRASTRPSRFMPLDHDGKIRMDCSSPYAMAGPDRRSRTSSTSPSATTPTPTATASSPAAPGCMNPNHYLAVAIDYLFQHRPGWTAGRRGGQDDGLERHDRPRGRSAWAARWSRCRSGSSGSWTGCSTARSASAARRARARSSCAATASRGPPTRTA